MSLLEVGPGKLAPDVVNVVVEIPANSHPVKYEVDKDTGAMVVDRILSTPMHYPCNYGFVPKTWTEDGDPADVLVLTPFPLQPGTVIACRPIGMLDMEDEAGVDKKVLAVPASGVTPLYDDIHEAHDLPDAILKGLTHFFEHYKDLEPNKWVKVRGWLSADQAKQAIKAAMHNGQLQAASAS